MKPSSTLEILNVYTKQIEFIHIFLLRKKLNQGQDKNTYKNAYNTPIALVGWKQEMVNYLLMRMTKFYINCQKDEQKMNDQHVQQIQGV